MFDTLQTKFTELKDDVIIYPAHGAGSLCGKNMSDASSSTLGNERQSNWAFQAKTKASFVEEILKDQPFIPSYFGFNVDINKQGASNYALSIANVPVFTNVKDLPETSIIVDIRDQAHFKKGHLEGSINIMARNENDKIETWLGAIIQPEEKFYLVVESVSDIETVLSRIAKIGYEKQIQKVVTLSKEAKLVSTASLNVEEFKQNLEAYTIIDIRNTTEHTNTPKFKSSVNHPLNDLRNTVSKIATEKPIVVHCAGGYRSAAGASILASFMKDQKVFDLSEAINDF
jgi:rhodanese-related sulfurtransferase